MKQTAHRGIAFVAVAVFIVVCGAKKERMETPLTTYIRHYEPLVFSGRKDNDMNLHRRVRRSTQSHHVVRLDFYAQGRNFSLRMRPHSQIFHPDVTFESVSSKGTKRIDFNSKQFLKGYVQDVPGSLCHGRMSNGVFDGIVYTHEDTFFIEPAHRYFHSSQSFDGVIFKSSDVLLDHPSHSHNKTNCGINEWMYKKMKMIQRMAQPVETNRTSVPSNMHSEPFGSENIYRRSEDAPLDTCNVLVAADQLFLQNVGGGSESEAISEITLHVDVANTIYRTTEFGVGYRPGLSVAKVKIYEDGLPVNFASSSVQDFLDGWSQINHESFCLAMLFTYRDFSGGVLGLAWVGYPQGSGTAGGICQQRVRLSSGIRSLNTAIVTLINFGERVPRKVSTITAAHEFGHNFGSEHDPDTSLCSPGSSNGGNYIMYARATDGDQPNNDEFSQCSINQIAAVLRSKAPQCFKPSRGSFCGNGLKESDEECDCGFPDECQSTDPCCTPQGGLGNDTECTFRSDNRAECSPKDGRCCDVNCKILNPPPTAPCKAASDCLNASYCNGSSGFCPDQKRRTDPPVGGRPCDNGTKTCVAGECSGSICTTINSTECFCENAPYLCHVCCLLSVPDSPARCLPTTDPALVQLNPNFRELLRPAGRSCQNYRGYCDSSGTCQGVDNNEVFNTLNKVLFSSESLNWIKDNWLVVVGIVLGIIFILVMLRITYKRKKPMRNLARKVFLSRRKKEEEAKQKKEKERKDGRVILPRLKNMFPQAQENILKDVIRQTVSEETAVKRLLGMGFLMRRW